MNDKQRNKLNMYVLVRDFLLASPTITSKRILFAGLYGSFRDYIAEIFAVSEQQERDNSGVTKTKKSTKEALIKKMLSISKKCIGYASGVEDLIFLQLIKITKSQLKTNADADLVKKAEDMIRNVVPKLADLVVYGIIASDLETLTVLKDDFLSIYTKPTSEKESTAQLTVRLNLLYKQADAVLLKIDDQLGSLFDIEPEFYDGYLRKRALVQLAKRLRAFEMWVADDETGIAMANVNIAITTKAKAGSELTKTVKRTGAKGSVQMNNLLTGGYEYEVNFGGYVLQRGSFFVNDGEMTTVKVRMKKIAVGVVNA